MNDKQIKGLSKYLSYLLRHHPEKINLHLDDYGWADVNELIEKVNANSSTSNTLTFSILEEVVANNNKKRFTFNEDKTKIRASQGHSIEIKLGYEAVEPPEFLYHGTATRFLDGIKKDGLKKMSRHHVHLSQEKSTASNVGQRHGKLVILIINSKAMHEAGHEFFVSENGVWLTDHVPVEFIEFG
jgi:putative RNA 2'-phosphotransferase